MKSLTEGLRYVSLKTMRIFLLILFLSGSFLLHATHNRAGEITYTQIGPNTIKVQVVTYTKASSPADRPQIELTWGDGVKTVLVRSSGYPKLFGPNLNVNLYEATHTYGSTGAYTIAFEDPNREEDIKNIPGSVNTPFYIYTKVILNSVLGSNNSPQLLYPPIDDACLGKLYLHNPGAYDMEGDSLVYSLVPCKGEFGANIDGYFLPSGCTLNPLTGDFSWLSPDTIGDFNFAILIDEYRDGYKIGSILRDMQVTVVACPPNDAPIIEVQKEICLEAGIALNQKVAAHDPNKGDVVTLTAVSSMFTLSAPALVFSQPLVAQDSVKGLYSWTPTCAQVRKQPYTILFKAHDDSEPVNLFDLETVSIHVIAPAPKNLTATAMSNTAQLTWTSGFCNAVKGYKIYRKENSASFVPDSCETGLPSGIGYTLVHSISGMATGYTDAALVLGKKYCYRVVAFFADGSESKVSEEACMELKIAAPALLNVSVKSTDQTLGAMLLRWKKPMYLDSVQNPGPYSYSVYRDGLLLQSQLADTVFTDTLLNTQSVTHQYVVELWNDSPGNSYLIGTSPPASSLFLQIQSLDKSLLLKWTVGVPWKNDMYYIWQESAFGSGVFTLIDSTANLTYTAKGLQNGQNYCYKIQSKGKYSASGYPSPLLNFSEVLCAVPKDTIPPCPPSVKVTVGCDKNENSISWIATGQNCAADLLKYSLYYKDELAKPYVFLKDLLPFVDTVYVHSDLEYVAGCYLITATDSTGNESDLGGEQCVDNCPEYALPNVFTPNGDGKNDFFRPFPYKHIQKIELRIYDRWGRLVFQTDNADIVWDGRLKSNGERCASGTYFYICEVHQKKLAGVQIDVQKGFLQLIGDGFNNK